MQQQNGPFFFDDQDSSFVFRFTYPNSSHKKDLNSSNQLTCTLTCRDVNNNQQKTGLFALHNKLLVYYQEDVSTDYSCKVLDVSYSRLRALPSNMYGNNYALSLSKNGQIFELIFTERDSMRIWYDQLKSLCVMVNFHETYKAHKMIGKGSFAKVFLVESLIDGTQYAVKTFAKEAVVKSNNTKAQASLLNEINLMRSLHHENIIRLHEVYETENSIYLVMELIEGKPLQAVLSNHSRKCMLTDRQIIEMIRSILEALAYISSKGIMHRDLKPDNILVDTKGNIKIVDFGLATSVNESDYIYKKCGTPGYIAPEVFKYDRKIPSTAYDSACDVFSAGCILFYMLFGFPLFDGVDGSETLELNRTFAEFHAVYVIKKEAKNQQARSIRKSGLRKLGLNLTLLLLEFDAKKRISAYQALQHPYFTSTHSAHLLTKSSSVDSRAVHHVKNVEDDDSSYTVAHDPEDRIVDNFKTGLLGKKEQTVASRNRFTNKDSLFLDVGKPEINGNVDSLSNKSTNNSIFMAAAAAASNKGTNSTSTSSFKKPQMLAQQKNKGQSKSFKHSHNNQSNQSFLKAAIFNNMHKKEGNKYEGPSREQSYSDLAPPASNGTSSPSSGSEDLDEDIGNEDGQVEANLAKVKIGTAEKQLSKKPQRFGTTHQKSLKN